MASGIPEYMDVTPRVTGLDKFAKDVGEVANIVDKTNKDISKKSATFQPFKFDTAAVSRNLASITSQFTNMWRGFDARSNVLSGFGNTLTQIGRNIRYFAFDFERLGRTLTTGITLPVIAAGTAIVKWGSDFEQSLRKVEVLVGQSRETVTRWGQEILTTMTGLGQSPNELAEGLFFAASAFGSMADKAPVMEVLRASAAGATIGLGEMGDVTRLVTAAVNAYSHSGLGAAEAMNILIRTVTEGNFEASKLATSFGRVLGSATALKIPFRDLATYIAGITRIGEDPSRIITSLNSSLLKMLNPTDQAQKILEQYGYTLVDVKKALTEDGGIFELFNEFRDVMSDQAFGKIFTDRAVRTVLVATDSMRAEMKQINDYMTKDEKKRLDDIEKYTLMKAQGINEEYASAMLARLDVDRFYSDQNKRLVIETLDTVQGQFKILKDTLQSSAIGVFQSIVQKPLLDFLKNVNQQMVTFNQTLQQNPQTVALIGKIALGLAALGPGVIIVSRLVQSLTVFTGVAGMAFRLAGWLTGSIVNLAVKGFGILGTVALGATRALIPILNVGWQIGSMIATRLIPALIAYSSQALFAVFRTIAMTSAFVASKVSIAALSGTITFFTGALRLLGFAGGIVSTVLSGIGTGLALFGGPALAAAAAVGGLVASFGAFVVAGGQARKIIKPFTSKIGSSFSQLKKEAGTWGEGLTTEYSNGIIRGAVYVIRALASLAKVIRSWLRPKSPPKILPEIDEWGKGTMEAWLSGWGKADFGILQDIMGDVGSYLKSVLDFGEDDNKDGIVAKMVLGSQKSLIDAINQVRATGTVAKDVLQRIFDDIGVTTPALRGYIRSQLQVAAATSKLTLAQDKLNKVTKQYESLLKPLERRLSKINAIQEDRDRDAREDELRRLLQTEIPDEIRAAATLELEEIGIERQISQLQQSQADTTAPLEDQVTIAEQELEAAQKQLEYFEGLMGLQENQAGLLGDIADMLKDIKDELKKLKEKLGEDMFGPGTPIEDNLIEGEFDIGGDLGLGDPLGELDKQLRAAQEEFENMKNEWLVTWNLMGATWQNWKKKNLDPMVKAFTDFKNNTLIPVADIIATGMDTSAVKIDVGRQELAKQPGFFEGLGLNAEGQTFGEWWQQTLQEAFGDLTWTGAAQSAVDNINNIIIPGFFGFMETIKNLGYNAGVNIRQMMDDFGRFFSFVGEMVDAGKRNYQQMKDDIAGVPAAFKESVDNFLTNFETFVVDIIEGLFGVKDESSKTRVGFGVNFALMGAYASNFQIAFNAAKLLLIQHIESLKAKFQEWWDQLTDLYKYIKNTFLGALDDIKELINDIKEEARKAVEWFGNLLTAAKSLVDDGLKYATTWFGNLLTAFTDLGNYISETFTGVFTSVLSTIETVLSKIGEVIQRLREALSLKNLLKIGDPGTTSDPTNPNPPGTDPAEESMFSLGGFAAEAVSGYNTPYPVNNSPFRNMPSIGATRSIAAMLDKTSANDHSVSVVVGPGGSNVMDGGVVVTFGDVHISNGMDFSEFESRVERVIVNSIQR